MRSCQCVRMENLATNLLISGYTGTRELEIIWFAKIYIKIYSRSNEIEASFLEMTHEHSTIRLTGNHIIFKLDKENNKIPVWAKTIVVGDKLSLGSKGNTTVLKV